MAMLILAPLVAAGCGARMPGMDLLEGEGSGPDITPDGVRFTFIDPNARKVNIVGDFNNWSTTADPLYDKEGDGRWTIHLPLKHGRYEYKFLVDNEKWQPDPMNPNDVDDGFGGLNSVLVVE
jgi:1,4-alpha-glucan branching enzyme